MRALIEAVNAMDSITVDGLTLPKGRFSTYVLIYGSRRTPVVVKSIGRSKIYEIVEKDGNITFEHIKGAGILYSVSHVKGYNEDYTQSVVTRKLVSVDLYEKLYKLPA